MKLIKDNSKFIIRISVTMFLITVAAALLLSGVNAFTSVKINENAVAARLEAMSDILPGYSFSDDFITVDSTIIYPMNDSGGNTAYCVQTVSNGFGGAIDILVGVTKDDPGTFRIAGVAILSMKETAGLGTRAKDPVYLSQYKGLTNNISIADSSSGANSVDAISGATITSKAVAAGVNAALDIVLNNINDLG